VQNTVRRNDVTVPLIKLAINWGLKRGLPDGSGALGRSWALIENDPPRKVRQFAASVIPASYVVNKAVVTHRRESLPGIAAL
jgi:hypothetical protein